MDYRKVCEKLIAELREADKEIQALRAQAQDTAERLEELRTLIEAVSKN